MDPTKPDAMKTTSNTKKHEHYSDTISSGGEEYDKKTVHFLINQLRGVGYGSKDKQQKSMKEVFRASILLAKRNVM